MEKETQALFDEAAKPSRLTREAVTAFQKALLEFTEIMQDQSRVFKRSAAAADRVEPDQNIHGRLGEVLQTCGAWEREIAALESSALRVTNVEAQFYRIMGEISVHAEKAGYKVKK